MWNIHEKYIRLVIIILFVSLYIIFNCIIKIKVNNLIYSGKIEIKNTRDFINKLNNYSIYRQPKYILLFDYIYSPICEDTNSFTIFEYYQENNIENVYYVLNEKTELYKSLLYQNKTKNIIPFKNDAQSNAHLFPFILNSKIIIQSYALFQFQKVVSHVK